MTYIASKKTRLLAGDFNLSSYATQVTLPWTAEMLDSTVFTDEAKTFIPGLDTSTAQVSGYYDKAEHADLAGWKQAAAQPLTIGPGGFALGADVFLLDALESGLTLKSAVASLVGFDFDAQTSGLTDIGVSLHDLEAETADGSETSYDGAAATSAGAVAHLHCAAYSGLDSIVVTIEDSANNSVWATIGTFTTLIAAGAERITIAGAVRRYVRATWDVTGTGSATFQVGLARR
jgi:hypothetical protein